jgi:hypothetical protein
MGVIGGGAEEENHGSFLQETKLPRIAETIKA